MSGIHGLLESTTRLKMLTLSFIECRDCPGGPLILGQALSSEREWSLLTFLGLGGMSTSAKDLIQLLTVGTPALQDLWLRSIVLLQGRWEGVIEVMHQSMHLFSMRIHCHHPLEHLGGQKFPIGLETIARGDWDWTFDEYVVVGGRHPCLLSDEPDSASEKFLSYL